MAAVERPIEVDPDHLIPALGRDHGPVALADVHAGAEDADVDPSVALDDAVDDRGHVRLHRDVERLHGRFATALGDRRGHAFQRLAPAPGQDDPATCFGEADRSGLTDAGTGPGHPRHLSTEILQHAVPPRLGLRSGTPRATVRDNPRSLPQGAHNGPRPATMN